VGEGSHVAEVWRPPRHAAHNGTFELPPSAAPTLAFHSAAKYGEDLASHSFRYRRAVRKDKNQTTRGMVEVQVLTVLVLWDFASLPRSQVSAVKCALVPCQNTSCGKLLQSTLVL